ncbi:MAG: ion channel [Alphaproteobacteria bacterium]
MLEIIANLSIASLLILTNIFIHAYGLSIISKFRDEYLSNKHSAFNIGIVVIGILFLHTVEVWEWALFYFASELLPNFETALYYSTTTYTTLGYGDVLLNPNNRLIGALQSAIGILLFGWSAAYIFDSLSHITQKRK